MQQQMKNKCPADVPAYLFHILEMCSYFILKCSSKNVTNQYFFILCFFRNGVDEELVCCPGCCLAEHNVGHYRNEFIFNKHFNEPNRDYGHTADCSESY